MHSTGIYSWDLLGPDDVHHWEVDTEAVTANIIHRTHSRLYPMDPRLDINALARELIAAINNGNDDDRLEWTPDRRRVHVKISVAIPETNKQTTSDRRKRFRSALEEGLAAGWDKVRPYTYEKRPLSHANAVRE